LKELGLQRVIASRFRLAGLFISAVLVLGMIVLILPRTVLSVAEATDGQKLAVMTLGEGSRVEVGYVHSMYGVQQKEVFSIVPGPVFRLEKVEFGSLAAAIYYDPDPPSGMAFENGVWVIGGGGKTYSVLTYRVSAESAHYLSARGRTIDLSGMSAGGDGLIRLSLERRSWLSFIFAP
jgi:hypothetical protein